MIVDIYTDGILKHFWKKSNTQKGKIYICEANKTVRHVNSNEQFTTIQWKYGKTKNIKNRMQMYGSEYKLLNTYDVNHLSLRENLIRSHNEIADDRRYFKDGRDEHVDFDCSEIVKLYANAKIKLEKENGEFRLNLYKNNSDEPFTSRSFWDLIDCFRL